MEICKEAAVKGIGTPDREELALMPTDWVYSPRLVNFSPSQNTAIIRMVIKTGVGTGMPGRKVPAYLKATSLIMGNWLLLIQAAMERPAVYMIRVATMGWMLK